MEANQVRPRAGNQGRQALRREGTLSTALMLERTATIGHGLPWLAARGNGRPRDGLSRGI